MFKTLKAKIIIGVSILIFLSGSVFLGYFLRQEKSLGSYFGQVFISNPVTGLIAYVKNNINTGHDELVVNLEGHECSENTTTTPLTASSTFTGSGWQDMLDYGVLTINVASDQNSATDGLEIQWSSDGLTTKDYDKFTILANTPKTFTFGPAERYYRVKFTNGAVNQTSFSLTSIIRKVYVKPSSHRITDTIVGQDDAELVKAVLSGVDSTGIFKNINATVDGDLLVADNSSGLAIAEGLVTGKSFIHKFGEAPDFDTADAWVTAWDGAADGTAWENMVYDYSTTADIDSISSSNAGDTHTVEVQGLDTNYAQVIQTATLQGQTRVALSTPLIRVFRMKNTSTTNFAGTIAVYVNTALTTGLPTDTSKIRALVNDGNNQTLMAVYTVPAGYTGYLRDWYSSLSNNVAATTKVRLFARPFGQVFQLKHSNAINLNGSSYIKHEFIEPEVFAEKTDIEIRVNTDGTSVATAAGFDIVLVQN